MAAISSPDPLALSRHALSFEPDSPLVAEVCAAANFEERKGGPPDMLLLHYTGLPSASQSIAVLSSAASRVSCHYVVDVDGRVTQLVPERLRAWHAGVSVWRGETDINSRSIGIEIQHPGHPATPGVPLPAFPERQIDAVIELGVDIVRRLRIEPERVLAHSDVAPLRKIDPGEAFPWRQLWRAGLGVWVEPERVDAGDLGIGPGAGGPAVETAQRLLADLGYGLGVTGEMDVLTTFVLTAFQRHFRPERVDGRLDRSTAVTLERLAGTAFPVAGS